MICSFVRCLLMFIPTIGSVCTPGRVPPLISLVILYQRKFSSKSMTPLLLLEKRSAIHLNAIKCNIIYLSHLLFHNIFPTNIISPLCTMSRYTTPHIFCHYSVIHLLNIIITVATGPSYSFFFFFDVFGFSAFPIPRSSVTIIPKKNPIIAPITKIVAAAFFLKLTM